MFLSCPARAKASWRFDLEQLELGIEVLLTNRHGGAFLGLVHPAPGVGGDLGNDLQTFGVEDVVGVEILLVGLLESDDGDFLQGQAVCMKALQHVLLDLASEGVAVLVQLAQSFGGGVAAKSTDDLGLEETPHLLRIKCFLSQTSTGREQIIHRVTNVGVQLRHHVDAYLVRGEDCLVARPGGDQLDGLERDPGHLMEHREHNRAPP